MVTWNYANLETLLKLHFQWNKMYGSKRERRRPIGKP